MTALRSNLGCLILLLAGNICFAGSDDTSLKPVAKEMNEANPATRSMENFSSVSIQFPRYITNSPVKGTVVITGEAPTKMTFYDDVDGRRSVEKVKANTKWIPFSTNITLDLTRKDGQRLLFYGFSWEKPERIKWGATWIFVWHSPLILFVTNPPQPTVSQPTINVLGYSPRPLFSIKYSVRSGEEEIPERFGFFGSALGDTNGFMCYDIPLHEGVNMVTLRAQDLASNTFVTNLMYTLDLKNDHTPPVMTLNFPKNNAKIASGSELDITGFVDDFTAKISAVMTSNGRTDTFQAMVGPHNGFFYIPHIPFSGPEGSLLLTAIDAAGNQSTTNLNLFRTPLVLIQNVAEKEGLSDLYKVSGTLSNADGKTYTVWVNGVKAQLENNCRWHAEHVRSSTPYGVATFTASAIPNTSEVATNSRSGRNLGTPDSILVSAPYATNGVNLDCIKSYGGQFKVHLSGTRNQSFIIFASTNLTEWIPLTTNYNSGENFEFVDPKAGDYPCRYYRVLPIK
jgi:hypothetical protein